MDTPINKSNNSTDHVWKKHKKYRSAIPDGGTDVLSVKKKSLFSVCETIEVMPLLNLMRNMWLTQMC